MGNHAPVGFSFIDCFARRETDKRPSHFLFFLRRPLTEEYNHNLWVNQDYVNLDLRTSAESSPAKYSQESRYARKRSSIGSSEERTQGKFYRAGSEVALFAVIASSSNGGPPLTFSVFRCIRRTVLSFCFCNRANSF